MPDVRREPDDMEPERCLPTSTRPCFAVLTIVGATGQRGYVIFDCLTARITDGVYAILDLALDVAAHNERLDGNASGMPPTTDGLGLRFPYQGEGR
jgi:hypothetical protein